MASPAGPETPRPPLRGPLSLLGWLGLLAIGVAMVVVALATPRATLVVRPALLFGLIAAVLGLCNVVGWWSERRIYVPPDPGGRLWA